MPPDNELMHYGVLGMRWGHRKQRQYKYKYKQPMSREEKKRKLKKYGGISALGLPIPLTLSGPALTVFLESNMALPAWAATSITGGAALLGSTALIGGVAAMLVAEIMEEEDLLAEMKRKGGNQNDILR